MAARNSAKNTSAARSESTSRPIRSSHKLQSHRVTNVPSEIYVLILTILLTARTWGKPTAPFLSQASSTGGQHVPPLCLTYGAPAQLPAAESLQRSVRG